MPRKRENTGTFVKGDAQAFWRFLLHVTKTDDIRTLSHAEAASPQRQKALPIWGRLFVWLVRLGMGVAGRWRRFDVGSCCAFLSGLQFTLIGIKRFLDNFNLGLAGKRHQALKLLPLQKRCLERDLLIPVSLPG